MSISSRGHDNILVLDSCAVPVTELFQSLINYRSIDEILKRYPVNINEIFECADACLDISPLTEEDFIEFVCEPRGEPADEEFDLLTKAVSDHLYISVISHAREFYPKLDDLDELYTEGLFLILGECVHDLSLGQEYFKCSELHSIVFDSFRKVFPHDVNEALDKLVKTFKLDVKKSQDTHDNN